MTLKRINSILSIFTATILTLVVVTVELSLLQLLNTAVIIFILILNSRLSRIEQVIEK